MTSMSDDVTLGEVYRSLKAFEADVNRRFDDLAYVPRGEYEERLRNNERHVAAIEERLRWAGRALVTAIFMTPVSVVITTWVVTK